MSRREPITEFRLMRFSSSRESTLGLLFLEKLESPREVISRSFMAYTLEDQAQSGQKVAGETRIPAGRYPLIERAHGGFHRRYKARWKWHLGMIEVADVPGFSDVLIHAGNTDDDTAGCILVGDSQVQNLTERGFIGSSRVAYKRVWEAIYWEMQRVRVHLVIDDYDGNNL